MQNTDSALLPQLFRRREHVSSDTTRSIPPIDDGAVESRRRHVIACSRHLNEKSCANNSLVFCDSCPSGSPFRHPVSMETGTSSDIIRRYLCLGERRRANRSCHQRQSRCPVTFTCKVTLELRICAHRRRSNSDHLLPSQMKYTAIKGKSDSSMSSLRCSRAELVRCSRCEFVNNIIVGLSASHRKPGKKRIPQQGHSY